MADPHVDELIRRFNAGDRDPDLLREIQRLAWECFHDPFEPPPSWPEAVGACPPETPSEEGAEGVETFTEQTIMRWAEDRRLKYLGGGDGVFLVVWAYRRSCDRVLRANIVLEGARKDALRVSIFGDRRVPADRFESALSCCNRWNAANRWPRAYLLPAEDPPGRTEAAPEPPLSGILVLDFQMPVGVGLSHAQFNLLMDRLVLAMGRFWDRAWREHGL